MSRLITSDWAECSGDIRRDVLEINAKVFSMSVLPALIEVLCPGCGLAVKVEIDQALAWCSPCERAFLRNAIPDSLSDKLSQ